MARKYTKKRASRSRAVVIRRRRRMHGKGFWSSLKKFGRKANTFLKKTHLISRAAKYVPLPYAGRVGQIAGVLGYGKKRRVVRRRKGRGINLPGAGINLAGAPMRRGRRGCGRKKKMRGGARNISLPVGY